MWLPESVAEKNMDLLPKIKLVRIIVLLSLSAAVMLAPAVWFGYGYHPHTRETKCNEIPVGSIGLVLGFEYQVGPAGQLWPGEGNHFLARKLVDCAERLAVVMTQQAIVEALISQEALVDKKLNGTVPVYLMHQHRADLPVRTLPAIQCALRQFSPHPETLVVLAHDKQQPRAVQDLQMAFAGEIIAWRVDKVPYVDKHPLNPLRWAARELFLARPAEAFLRWVGKKPHLSPLGARSAAFLGGFDCPAAVEIQREINFAGEFP
jgi:hypothetical protein